MQFNFQIFTSRSMIPGPFEWIVFTSFLGHRLIRSIKEIASDPPPEKALRHKGGLNLVAGLFMKAITLSGGDQESIHKVGACHADHFRRAASSAKVGELDS